MNNFISSYFRVDLLSGSVAAAIGLFFVLTLVYSLKFTPRPKPFFLYCSCIVLTALSSVVVALSNNLILLLSSWGFLGLLLYILINMGDESCAPVAKKALIIVGGTDALMLLGIGIVYYFAKSFQMNLIRLELNNGWLVSAYLCIAVASFAKAGAMPMHSWIPDCAKSAPVPVSAYLPASLDKLLGIYLLTRLSLDLFVMNRAMNNLLMLVGAITIIAAVMMALLQHNLKKLLGYHAVSQVGYMILGIGTGTPIGIAGGIFHMFNNAIYKSCLFFTAGNVESRAKTSELDELGGLAKFMPLTYFCALIASFSICGVPPFNGFVSKWLIYQGLISGLQAASSGLQAGITIFCLITAMFGSALTLASFMKLLHAVFLGERLDTLKTKDIREVPWQMWLPCLILALACVGFGVLAFSFPLKYIIFPLISEYQPLDRASLLGIWSPGEATLLVSLGLLFGFVIFKLAKIKFNLRQSSSFTGAETKDLPQDSGLSGVDFYNTVKENRLLKNIYKKAQSGSFDIYEQGKKIFIIWRPLQWLHNGVLPSYLVWILLGMAGIFWLLVK